MLPIACKVTGGVAVPISWWPIALSDLAVRTLRMVLGDPEGIANEVVDPVAPRKLLPSSRIRSGVEARSLWMLCVIVSIVSRTN